MKNKLIQNHPYHLVTLSPWPIINALNLFNLLFSMIYWFNLNMFMLVMFNFLTLIISMNLWWRDIIRESTFQGNHTMSVTKLLKLSMILFITSELFFFISFFWTYFHNSISPSIEIGMMWPPKNIYPLNPFKLPLLNSLILISSGFTLTWSHNCILNKKYKKSIKTLFLTIILGLLFMMIQFFEYFETPFCINDSIFGSIFFLTTGFHGLHVMIGIIFLLYSMIRLNKFHFSSIHHFNFESSSWYWHFVDVIWLFLYLSIYWWNF
uniref:Cytochrome c oxidase subunit 3 n=1 Tax=Coelioxys fenestrata TaxID=621226 RepID=A0A7T4WNY5_9HYME|nr:cytochrome c oxidase subunit III [Coelioxys fenestrata]QQD78148.1 cytochrome c oxidase subunit 3 [Coelioxys fenestrata]